MAETWKLVRDVMQKDWGWGEVVHPEKAKELILQVIIPSIFYYLAIPSGTFLTRIFAPSSFIFLFISLFSLYVLDFRAYVRSDSVPN